MYKYQGILFSLSSPSHSSPRPANTLLPNPPNFKEMSHIEEPHSHFPLAGVARDGWSNDKEATATCFCGAVQLAFPTQGPGLAGTFICNCHDCRKLTASTFATNFTILDTHLTHIRGESNLSTFSQSTTIASGHVMANYFCSTCGTLMYRVGAGFPGMKILRTGTVDDFTLHETKLKPTVEQFVKDRVAWLTGAEGIEQVQGNYYV